MTTFGLIFGVAFIIGWIILTVCLIKKARQEKEEEGL
jgi:uncharacterized membrane protein YciS (DUF1049 family)